MDGTMVEAALHRIAQEIVEANPDLDNVVLLGVLSRGRPLADRLTQEVRELTGHKLRVGSLATTLYRDDLRSGSIPAVAGSETHFDFDIHGATVILVDDVLSTGRTIRAALDEIIDYGRPARIQLACLVDRGLRELPIQADYLGWTISTRADDHVAVHVRELDGEDAVLHVRPVATTGEGEP
ncbi:MAG: bifunctional pyr operon transcriptional regulator/uracil phosphoribosyltransferase PyrR [Candidatus Hydrogenedentes bacterium]|nr:bifunctional pyr operon transcriptional regulator/uracil phosphoribosyltransferase PyrR [Candidatus Hydrogenedentota bacterium]